MVIGMIKAGTNETQDEWQVWFTAKVYLLICFLPASIHAILYRNIDGQAQDDCVVSLCLLYNLLQKYKCSHDFLGLKNPCVILNCKQSIAPLSIHVSMHMYKLIDEYINS